MTNMFKTLAVAAVAAGAVAVVPMVASATSMTPGNTTAYELGTTSTTNLYFWQSSTASGAYLPVGDSETLDFLFTATTAIPSVGQGSYLPTVGGSGVTGYVAWFNADSSGNKIGSALTTAALSSSAATVSTSFAANDYKIFEIYWDPLPQSQIMQATVSTVPVPATGFLLLGGIGAFGALRRRKKKAAA